MIKFRVCLKGFVSVIFGALLCELAGLIVGPAVKTVFECKHVNCFEDSA